MVPAPGPDPASRQEMAAQVVNAVNHAVEHLSRAAAEVNGEAAKEFSPDLVERIVRADRTARALNTDVVKELGGLAGYPEVFQARSDSASGRVVEHLGGAADWLYNAASRWQVCSDDLSDWIDGVWTTAESIWQAAHAEHSKREHTDQDDEQEQD